MPEGHPRVWFVCMYCKRAYKRAKELVEHKRHSHSQQFQEYLRKKGRVASIRNVGKRSGRTNNKDEAAVQGSITEAKLHDEADPKDGAALHGKHAEAGATKRLSITEAEATASTGDNAFTLTTKNTASINELSITDKINSRGICSNRTEATSAPTHTAATTTTVKLTTNRMKVEPLKLCLTRTGTAKNMYAVSPPKKPCPKCGKQFLSAIALKVHIRKFHHHKFKCSQCKKIFKTAVSFKIHQGTHGAKNFQCFYCQKSFSHPRSRLFHAQEDHQHIIQQMFDNQDEPAHLEVQAQLPCKREPATKWERFYNHICSVCQRGFIYQKNLEKHMSTHAEESSGNEPLQVIVQHAPLDCPLCKKRLSSKNSVKEHLMRIHGLSHNDAVSKIEQSSSDAYGLVKIKAERVVNECRTGIVPCQSAEAAFMEDKIRQKLQCGVVSYECRICWISFSYKTDAVSHVQEVHWDS